MGDQPVACERVSFLLPAGENRILEASGSSQLNYKMYRTAALSAYHQSQVGIKLGIINQIQTISSHPAFTPGDLLKHRN